MMIEPPAILILEARFYEDIADALIRGALAELERYGARASRVAVPGALEIPQALALAHRGGLIPGRGMAGGFDGCVALGCVIRGETAHYDIVAGESARALMDLSVAHGIPLGNGILTVENHAQALERALPERRNKGADAVHACLRLIEIAAGFDGTHRRGGPDLGAQKPGQDQPLSVQPQR